MGETMVGWLVAPMGMVAVSVTVSVSILVLIVVIGCDISIRVPVVKSVSVDGRSAVVHMPPRRICHRRLRHPSRNPCS
jgi:hypothetical protein